MAIAISDTLLLPTTHSHRTRPQHIELPPMQGSRAPRPSRRATSYYNSFQTSCAVSNDLPPTYAVASRQRPPDNVQHGREPLPNYSCTVGIEAKLLLNLESTSPLHGSSEGEWREVYAVVRGTIISFHRLKDGGPGKLLRSYTLQHAEVGLASDAEHTILVPQSRLAHLVPSAARRRAWQKDPEMFKAVPQTLMRLRAETDQMLLADSQEERIYQFIYTISAGIDIALAIDERSIPRQCTVPRRRRRQGTTNHGDLHDPALLAEQERIFRQMYPAFSSGARPELQRATTAESNIGPSTPTREEEEVDLSMFREEAPASAVNTPASERPTRPENARQMTSNTIRSTFANDMIYATPSTNFDSERKWHPPHLRSPAQVQRYIRRCMPVLLADSVRASEIVIVDGRRMRINWRMELMEEWELQPPSYKAHNFEHLHGTELTRTQSHRSVTGDHSETGNLSSSSVLHISPVEAGMEHLQLSKVLTADEASTNTTSQTAKSDHSPQQVGQVQGIVFCF
ncbi:hypothetical protein AC578_5394 [Pseudocercospora eumusae]|uniref:Uncharacterized protein n=1 Tax=Pseudocercospora eumusae TaxID=321146 RepID=A0A139HJZ6_9PEZI|nr:hypothetical protein AC578_5394 [Pseudocercospora eumusae]